MDKNTILAAFSFPIFLVVFMAWKLTQITTDGFAGLGEAILLAAAIISAFLVGITLFVLRAKQMHWWQALLISIGSLPAGFILIILFVYIGDLLMGYR